MWLLSLTPGACPCHPRAACGWKPAIKCRGREHLRIIYGPDYDQPEHLERLRRRGLGANRSLAVREITLGLEALHCSAAREPLRRVHERVLGVLALESEPVTRGCDFLGQ